MKFKYPIKNRKKYIPVIIILVVIIGFVGVFCLEVFLPRLTKISTSTSKQAIITDTSTDWKTYVNKKYNFNVDYPSQWRNDSMSKGPDEIGYTDTTGYDDFVQISLVGLIQPSLEISIEKSSVPPEQFRTQNIEVMNSSLFPDFKNLKQYEKEFNGIKMFVSEYERNNSYTSMYYFSSLDEKYVFIIGLNDDINNTFKVTLNRILSTFEFTN